MPWCFTVAGQGGSVAQPCHDISRPAWAWQGPCLVPCLCAVWWGAPAAGPESMPASVSTLCPRLSVYTLPPRWGVSPARPLIGHLQHTHWGASPGCSSLRGISRMPAQGACFSAYALPRAAPPSLHQASMPNGGPIGCGGSWDRGRSKSSIMGQRDPAVGGIDAPAGGRG